MDISNAERALKKVAERNGVTLETVLGSISDALQGTINGQGGCPYSPEEMVVFLSNVVIEVRRQQEQK